MKTIVEIFPSTCRSGKILFTHLKLELKEDKNPSEILNEIFIKFSDMFSIPNSNYIWHSTSWRYEKPETIILTYILFSENLSFKNDFETLEKEELSNYRFVDSNQKSDSIPAREVFIHGIRHLSFLVKNDKLFKNHLEENLDKSTIKLLKDLYPVLAGEI